MYSSKIKIDSPISGIEMNKDKSKVAAVGRRAFKIYSLDDGRFSEEYDLRGSDVVNLNYSFTDVAWNLKDECILATAATNGAIIIWNLHKNQYSKQDRTFLDHKRTVNRVCFHPVDPLLLSCSQDSTVRCFDLRSKEPVRVFKSRAECFRDVKFNPHSSYTFATVSENGVLNMWDLRKGDKCYIQYTAHGEPIYSCDWHPEAQWLATASRDKSIKIWDIIAPRPVLKYTITTIASVGKVKWRPHQRFQLASTSLVVDHSINIWDLRRPYIPFACFGGHNDAVTDIAWKNDSQWLLSSGRDSQIIQHAFAQADRPSDLAIPYAVSVSNMGNIFHASRVIITSTPKSAKFQGLGILRRSSHVQDEFSYAVSHLRYFNLKKPLQKTDPSYLFKKFAEKYMLTGGPITTLCEHNANIAKKYNKPKASFLWNVIKQIFCTNFFDFDDHASMEEPDSVSIGREETTDDDSEISKELAVTFDFDDDFSEMNSFVKLQPDELITDPCAVIGDFLFGDKEMDPLSLDYDNCENLCLSVNGVFADKFDLDEKDWNIPNEAFPLRHEIKDSSLPPELMTNMSTFTNEDCKLPAVKFVKSQKDPVLLNIKWTLSPVRWDYRENVARALLTQAESGDFQTAVSVLLALGDKRRQLCKVARLDEATQEQWLLSYIDLLQRFQLFNKATEVINLSWIPEAQQLNQHTTTMRSACGKCRRMLMRSGWLCDRCHSTSASMCCVCHNVVKGLYVWCQGCSHGGHLAHIQAWLEENTYCPTGCGHACEY